MAAILMRDCRTMQLRANQPMGRRWYPREVGMGLRSHSGWGTVVAFALPIRMNAHKRTVRHLVPTLVWIGFVMPVSAQEVSIPDPNLDVVVREALQKPAGPLTQQDMLGLTGLS